MKNMDMDVKRALMAEYRQVMLSGRPVQPFVEKLIDTIKEEKIVSARRLEMLKTLEHYIGPKSWAALFGEKPSRD